MKSLISIMLLFIVTSSAFAQRAQPSCEAAYGQTACGYDCEAAYGKLQCAQTPYGVCGSAYGIVKCYDPEYPSRNGVPPKCEAAYGKIECGYNCTSGYGEVKCGKTPTSVCVAAYGEVKCQDFIPVRRDEDRYGSGRRSRDRILLPGKSPECKSGYGKNVCGYSCVAAYGEVRCAQTPQGVCGSGYGEVKCFDPISPRRWDPPAQCLAGYGVVECGYNCVAGYGEVKCRQTPY